MFRLFKSLLGDKSAKHAEIQPFGARFEVPPGQTLLEAALQNNVPFPHDCTVGTCGACKCRLKEGRVKAITDFGYTLSSEEMQAGYILACQAVPRDEVTVIEVEDVQAMPPVAEYRGRIRSRTALTHDIERVTIALEGRMPFIAGQYANVAAPGLERARSYSFASPPAPDGNAEIDLFVRKVPGGAFTAGLFGGQFDKLTLAVDGPHGSFFLRDGAGPMMCIAGGSGLAPLISLLKDACNKGIRRRCVLLFGGRSQRDLYALDEIAEIAAAWGENFRFIPVLSEEPADSDWTGARGLVTHAIAGALPESNWQQVQGYLCGPPGMIDAAIGVMIPLGVDIGAIHYDKFTDQSHVAPKVGAA